MSDDDIPIPVTADEWRDAWYRHVPMLKAEIARMEAENAALRAELTACGIVMTSTTDTPLPPTVRYDAPRK